MMAAMLRFHKLGGPDGVTPQCVGHDECRASMAMGVECAARETARETKRVEGYVEVTLLPRRVQETLHRLGYAKSEIMVYTSDHYTLSRAGGSGYQEHVTLVNIGTGASETHTGSWGGPNMFATCKVDSDHTERPLAVDMAVIDSRNGGGKPVHASITVHPSMVAEHEEHGFTALDREALAAVVHYKSFARRDHYAYIARGAKEKFGTELPAFDESVARFVREGYLSQNKAGAISATVKGRNAARGARGYVA